MIKIITQIITITPLLVALFSVFITVFTFIIIRSGIKNRKVRKTLKLLSELKYEQKQLLKILRQSKDTIHKKSPV